MFYFTERYCIFINELFKYWYVCILSFIILFIEIPFGSSLPTFLRLASKAKRMGKNINVILVRSWNEKGAGRSRMGTECGPTTKPTAEGQPARGREEVASERGSGQTAEPAYKLRRSG